MCLFNILSKIKYYFVQYLFSLPHVCLHGFSVLHCAFPLPDFFFISLSVFPCDQASLVMVTSPQMFNVPTMSTSGGWRIQAETFSGGTRPREKKTNTHSGWEMEWTDLNSPYKKSFPTASSHDALARDWTETQKNCRREVFLWKVLKLALVNIKQTKIYINVKWGKNIWQSPVL